MCRAEMVDSLDASRVSSGIEFFYTEPEIKALLERWWAEEMLPRVPAALSGFFAELIHYDLITRPIYASPRFQDHRLSAAKTQTVLGESYYVLDDQIFSYNIPSLVENIRRGSQCDFTPSTVVTSLYFKVEFCHYIHNHEFVCQFVGKTWQQLLDESTRPVSASTVSTEGDRMVSGMCVTERTSTQSSVHLLSATEVIALRTGGTPN
jgi:hypothetical protein